VLVPADVVEVAHEAAKVVEREEEAKEAGPEVDSVNVVAVGEGGRSRLSDKRAKEAPMAMMGDIF